MSELKIAGFKQDGNILKIGSIEFAGKTLIKNTVTVAADTAHSFSLKDGSKNYGTLILDADRNLILKGGADLAGDIYINDSTDENTKLIQVDFSAPVSVVFDPKKASGSGSGHYHYGPNLKVINGSTGADSISVSNYSDTDFIMNAGAGNDTVLVSVVAGKVNAGAGNDVVSVSGANGEVALGAGKDTIKFNGTDGATVTLTDYNFNDDIIELNGAALSSDGKLTAGDKVVFNGLTANNSLYLARISKTADDPTTVLATAEEDATKVVINASTIKKEETVIINAASADSANITLGKASVVSVSLNTDKDAGVDVIKIGDTKADVSVTATNFFTDDVLNFTGLTFANTSIGSVASGGDVAVTLGSGKVSLNLGTGVAIKNDNEEDVFAKFNLNGTTLYAATDNGQEIDLSDETDLSKILVKGGNDETSVQAIRTTAKWVDLSASNIYNINAVKLTKDAVAKTSVVGTKNNKAGITVDAADVTDGVAIWANNSGKAGDVISLSSSEDAAANTLWFGTADGNDKVVNFNFETDILYLYDSLTLTADKGTIKAGKATMTFEKSQKNGEEIMQVQGAKFDGTVYAAGDFDQTAIAPGVIVLGDHADKVNYYAVAKDAFISVTAGDELESYTFLKDIDYAGATKANIADKGSVASIDASGFSNTDGKVIIEGVANVTLGAGTNEVWVNGAGKNATVQLNGTSNVDKVWFGASDKNVTVSGFETESDVIALVGNIGEFTAKMDGSNAVISNASKGKLTVNAISDIALVDGNGANYKLYVAENAEYTTNTDGTNIYLGEQLSASSEVTDTTTIVVAEGVNKWGLNSSAIVSKTVKTIDMSSSSADLVLVGSANAANTITGGTGTNWLNGGGASKDVLNGNTGAIDFFYYGKEDGNDTLINVGAEDQVVLYDIATTDLAAVKVGDDKTVITVNNDSKLTVTGSVDGLTFVLTDGTYKYDSSIEKAEDRWVKQ